MMKKFLFGAVLILPVLTISDRCCAEETSNKAIGLWYAQPAEKWTDALPVGNGRVGAMVFGRVFDERIQFNEDTLWKGSPHDYDRAGAHDHLADIQKLLSDGNPKEAADLTRATFLSDPVRQKAYQPFGDLLLHFTNNGEATDYRRELDLDSAIAVTSYRVGGIRFKREVFASHPDQAIIVRITADQPHALNFSVQLTSPHTNSQSLAIASDTLALTGQVETNGLRFESRVQVICEGGTVKIDGGTVKTNGGILLVNDANSATLLLVAATGFKNFQDISGDSAKKCAHDLAAVSRKTFENILAAHLTDYRRLFRRVSLSIGQTARADLPTSERLELVKSNGLDGDPALAALYFQYGRYLLISSSRPGGQPANLQGLWNEALDPPWESKWTLNINCEMNYWPVELCNLSECAEPLFAMIDDLAVSGARTAKEQYGSRGWVVHHNTDLWRGAAPINNIDGVWPTGGAWLCYHLWEHYLFTGDEKFLARAYPDMKGASLFFMDDLIKDPKSGWLITSPSFSPEQGTLCYGPTMDNQLIRALMDSTIAAADILKTDKSFVAELKKTRDRLPPNQVGKYGQLQEWLSDIDKPNNNHRHMSPLWALYPGADITPGDGKIWDAAKLLLKWRGAGSTGWSYAWRIPLWARVNDGEYAYQQLTGLFQHRTLPNLFDLCGPFQIDGNFGATAGIVEMLLQSQWTEKRDGKNLRVISVLPALPTAWPTGSVKGLCARDGLVMDFAWEGGALKHLIIHSKSGKPCLLRTGGREIVLQTQAGKDYAFDGKLQASARN
jgi:alpha-L-fucosidase 2